MINFQDIQERLAAAHTQYRKGKFKEALAALDKLQKELPQLSDVTLGRIYCLHRLDRTYEAFVLANKLAGEGDLRAERLAVKLRALAGVSYRTAWLSRILYGVARNWLTAIGCFLLCLGLLASALIMCIPKDKPHVLEMSSIPIMGSKSAEGKNTITEAMNETLWRPTTVLIPHMEPNNGLSELLERHIDSMGYGTPALSEDKTTLENLANDNVVQFADDSSILLQRLLTEYLEYLPESVATLANNRSPRPERIVACFNNPMNDSAYWLLCYAPVSTGLLDIDLQASTAPDWMILGSTKTSLSVYKSASKTVDSKIVNRDSVLPLISNHEMPLNENDTIHVHSATKAPPSATGLIEAVKDQQTLETAAQTQEIHPEGELPPEERTAVSVLLKTRQPKGIIRPGVIQEPFAVPVRPSSYLPTPSNLYEGRIFNITEEFVVQNLTTRSLNLTAETLVYPSLPWQDSVLMTVTPHAIGFFYDECDNAWLQVPVKYLAPDKTATITIRSRVRVVKLNLTPDEKQQNAKDPVPAVFIPFMRDLSFWEKAEISSDNRVFAETVPKIVQQHFAPYTKAKSVYDWVVRNIGYAKGKNERALKAFSTRSGACVAQSRVLVAILRASGIPAREVLGYNARHAGGRVGLHGWVEVYLPGSGWVLADSAIREHLFAVSFPWFLTKVTAFLRYPPVIFASDQSLPPEQRLCSALILRDEFGAPLLRSEVKVVSAVQHVKHAVSSGYDLKRIQQQLASFGLDPGICDGKWSAKTQIALRSYQKKQGLDITGRLDTKTLSALFNPGFSLHLNR